MVTLSVLLYAIPLIIAITLHEAAHGWVAYRCGDPTAQMMERVTFNPLRHIDPVGTLLLPGLFMLMGSPVMLGWAKPVPVDFSRLRHKKRDTIFVAAAGPGMNFFLAFLSAVAIRFTLPDFVTGEYVQSLGIELLAFSMLINLVLMVFNLFPILPLDGGRILQSLLPDSWARQFARTERFGMIILFALMLLPPALGSIFDQEWNLFAWVLAPVVDWLAGVVTWLAGVPESF